MSIKPKTLIAVAVLTVFDGVLVSCGGSTDSGPNATPGDTGRVGATLAVPSADFDVVAVLFEVTNEDGRTQSQIVPLHPEPLPANVDPDLAGHRFADWFVVLNPGVYTVRATPLQSVDPAAPSDACEAVEGQASVFPEMTTELVLVANCMDENSGGLDTVVVLNRLPFIEEIEFDPSKFVCAREVTEMTATASDGDELTFDWQVTGLPDGAGPGSFSLTSVGPSASFSATVPGRYELTLTVSDDFGEAQVTFPVYVVDCGNEVRCETDADCDDGLFCNGTETSQAGVCIAGTPSDVDD